MRAAAFLIAALSAAGMARTADAQIAFGEYDCMSKGSQKVEFIFTLHSKTEYTDASGVNGSVKVEGGMIVTFTGGALDDVRAIYAPNVLPDPPTLTLAMPEGMYAGGLVCYFTG